MSQNVNNKPASISEMRQTLRILNHLSRLTGGKKNLEYLLKNHDRCNKVVAYLLRLCEQCIQDLEKVRGSARFEPGLSDSLRSMGIESILLSPISACEEETHASEQQSYHHFQKHSTQQAQANTAPPALAPQPTGLGIMACNDRQSPAQLGQPQPNPLFNHTVAWGAGQLPSQAYQPFANYPPAVNSIAPMLNGYCGYLSQAPGVQPLPANIPILQQSPELPLAADAHPEQPPNALGHTFNIDNMWTEGELEGLL